MHAIIILSSVSGVCCFVFSVGDKLKINDLYKYNQKMTTINGRFQYGQWVLQYQP